MRKLNFFLLFMAVSLAIVCVLLAKSLVKKSPALILSERSLTDTALSLFRDDIQALTAAQIQLQQQEINSRLLKLSEQDAQTRAKIESIPFWMSTRRNVYLLASALLGVSFLSVVWAGCLVFIRRKSLVTQTYGTAVLSLPYRQINSENGAIRVIQTALTHISQGTLDKEDLFRLFEMTRARAVLPATPVIDIGGHDAPALMPGQMPSVSFQEAARQFHPHEILTGFDAEQRPVYLPVKGFVSAAVGGESGSGKTSKLRFLLAQLICSGVHVSILDAHEGMEESLVSSLGSLAHFPNVTIYHSYDARESIDSMTKEVETFIDAKRPANPPRIYVLDELRPINHVCSVEYLMDKIANEGRKFNIFGVFASQTWEAKMFKERGSSARDACVLKMAARMPKEQARILFKDKDAAHEVSHLATPEMYMSSIRYTGKLQVPFAAPADMEMLALEYMEARQKAVGEVDNCSISPRVSQNVSVNVSNGDTMADTNQTQTETQGDTWLSDYMRDTGKTKEQIAEIWGSSVSLVKEILRGARKLTSERKEMLIDALEIDSVSNIIQFPGGKNL